MYISKNNLDMSVYAEKTKKNFARNKKIMMICGLALLLGAGIAAIFGNVIFVGGFGFLGIILLLESFFLFNMLEKSVTKKINANNNVEITYAFGDQIEISTVVNDFKTGNKKEVKTNLKYDKLKKIEETENILKLYTFGKNFMEVKIDAEYNNYREFVTEKMKGRYIKI